MRQDMPSDVGANEDETNLSLAGCGYLGIYHVGVASCIRKFAPYILTRNKISGASVGALVAAAYACNVPLDLCTNSVFDVSMRVRSGILGPITPDLNIMQLLYDNMSSILPDDAHIRCSGRLFISVTRYDDCENVLLSQFETKEDLVKALMCSSFIPLYCGYEPPEFHGVAYVDGGYSDNSPYLDKHTVQVAPFYGETGICPKDKEDKTDFRKFNMNNTSIYLTMKNCQRLFRILFPGPPDMLKELCQKGFNDALLFLRDRGIIECPECTPEINGNEMSASMKHINCKPIEHPLPTEISIAIDKVVSKLSQNLSYRLFKNPFVKALYYVNIPSIFTVRMSCALLAAVTRKLQHKASSCVDNVFGELPQIISEILQQANLKSKFMCHIDFTDNINEDNQDKNINNVNCEKIFNNHNLIQVNNKISDIYPNKNLLHPKSDSVMQNNSFSKTSTSKLFHFAPKSALDLTLEEIRNNDVNNYRCDLSEKSPNHINGENISAQKLLRFKNT